MPGKNKGTMISMGIGVCASHPVPIPVIVTFPLGTPTCFSEGQMNINQGSIGNSSCGHTGTPATFSMTVFEEKLGSHRLTDVGNLSSGTYSIANGAITVFAGD